MKEEIKVSDYAQKINEALSTGGILLNTKGEKFNSMVIGWGHLGRIWNLPTFAVYVREHRYTKAVIDKTKEFTLSIPEGAQDKEILRVCGSLSGNNIDKVIAAGLELEGPKVNHTHGIRQYPITLECKVLYQQVQDLSLIPEYLRTPFYPQDIDGSNPMANRDPHTMYIGEIVASYMIK